MEGCSPLSWVGRTLTVHHDLTPRLLDGSVRVARYPTASGAAVIRFDQLPFSAVHQFRTTVMGASLVSEDTADEIRKRWPSGATS